MFIRHYIGYLLAGLILLFHVFASDLSQRLDWINFGSDYRAAQQDIISAIRQVDQSIKGTQQEIAEIKSRLRKLENAETIEEKK